MWITSAEDVARLTAAWYHDATALWRDRLRTLAEAIRLANAAVAAFTKVLACEVATHNVSANLVALYFLDRQSVRQLYPDEDHMQATVSGGPLPIPCRVLGRRVVRSVRHGQDPGS